MYAEQDESTTLNWRLNAHHRSPIGNRVQFLEPTGLVHPLVMTLNLLEILISSSDLFPLNNIQYV